MTFDLNKQQQEIVEAPIGKNALRILAGPGAGKTEVMVRRIGYMIDQGIHPDQITAVSFSKVAADELKERVAAIAPSANGNQICTIHALCHRGLQDYGLIRKVAVGRPDGKYNKMFAEKALEHASITEVGWKDFLAYVNSAKGAAIRPDFLAHYYDETIENNGGIQEHVVWRGDAGNRLAAAHIKFDKLMAERKLYTFADMLCLYEWALEDDQLLLDTHRNKTDHLLIDEAQDTNPQAMRILQTLAAPQDNVTVIGDPDQSIYGFIGARPEDNMQHGFEERYKAKGFKTFMLETNYRSTETIVDFVGQAIDKNYDESNEKYRKNLVPRKGAKEGKAITYETYMSVDQEAQAVAEKIQDMMWDDDRLAGDFYVLGRVRALLAYMYAPLFRMKIPFVDRCGGSFWDLAHVQDLLAYMALSVDKGNDVAFQRIYNKASNQMRQPWPMKDREDGHLVRDAGDPVHHRFLGKEFLKACEGSFFMMVSASKRSWQAGINDLRNLMTTLDDDKYKEPGALADGIIDLSLRQYWAMAEGGVAGDDGESPRIADMLTVADMASQFENTQEFLDHVNEMKEKVELAAKGDDSKVVVLSTIHRVKGSERPVVMQMGLMDGLLPHWRALDNGVITAPKSGSVLPFSSSGSIIGERRLWFVAASRAKEELHCTGSRVYQNKLMVESQFAFETQLRHEVVVTADSKEGQIHE